MTVKKKKKNLCEKPVSSPVKSIKKKKKNLAKFPQQSHRTQNKKKIVGSKCCL